MAATCFYSRGPGTYRVEQPLPVQARSKLVASLAEAGVRNGVVLLKGGISACRVDTDHEELFRQESYFAYLTGVADPDCWATIELPSGRSTLFVPRLGDEYAVWMGELKSPAEYAAQYRFDVARFVDELKDCVAAALLASGCDPAPSLVCHVLLNHAAGEGAAVHVLTGTNSDSGVDIALVHDAAAGAPVGAPIRRDVLFNVLAECRVTKSAGELDLMSYASWISSMAHVDVMREVHPGMLEYQLEARFLFHIAYHGGCRHSAYTCICACGPNSAILHYGHAGAPNERVLSANDIALLDMGAEYYCYCSDITCSYPVSRTFSPDQRFVYEIVLEAQKQILAAMKPGVAWPDMHRLMWRILLTGLKAGDVLVGDVEAMLAAGLGAVFVPCGLGHLIGLDTHDVGGYLPGCPPRIQDNGIKKLRTARTLQPGMVLTVEPGCYFMEALLQPALADPSTKHFFNVPVLQRFRGFGGVRLEDVVAVTDTGVQNFTLCPRTVAEVESVMAGGPWPPAHDRAPWMKRKWVKLDKESGRMVADASVSVAAE